MREPYRRLAKILARTRKNGTDGATREGMPIGVNFACQAFSNNPVTAVQHDGRSPTTRRTGRWDYRPFSCAYPRADGRFHQFHGRRPHESPRYAGHPREVDVPEENLAMLPGALKTARRRADKEALVADPRRDGDFMTSNLSVLGGLTAKGHVVTTTRFEFYRATSNEGGQTVFGIPPEGDVVCITVCTTVTDSQSRTHTFPFPATSFLAWKNSTSTIVRSSRQYGNDMD
ncbi:hypothetical protein SAMN05892877_119100 [Rhizobium subbaraonis]|uniref:Uncharacterized protein n=1 Tax=Rhizobium subbaraonis TaxID=908946 RepID=A0A285UZ23_9HYPH|nr:hypothetical protein SAMN05892877_119100 [Rhizobium subbaraonis]